MEKPVASYLERALNFVKPKIVSVGGGSINHAFRIESNNKKYFCKLNNVTDYPELFQREAEGLQFLSETNTIRTTDVLHCAEVAGQQLLVLEWIEQGARTTTFWRNFGEQLAALHQHSSADGFHGFGTDNYMGALWTNNTRHSSWTKFFIECRLRPQVGLATSKNLLPAKDAKQFEQLEPKLNSIFNDEPAAALHGDLWSGNFLCSENSEPVLIDPAVYYGHRSIDLGMTTLFGGFDKAFYDGYHHHYPLPPNHREQWDVCNLYPLLIHLNLFGTGYLSSIRSILNRYA